MSEELTADMREMTANTFPISSGSTHLLAIARAVMVAAGLKLDTRLPR